MALKSVTTASGGVKSPPLFCVQSTGNDDPAPWPYRYTIRARFSDDVPIVVRGILRSTLNEWLSSQPSNEIRVEWVETGDSDVRFSLNASGVTACTLGRNVPTNQQQPTVSLALRAWKIDESEVVWTHLEIERMARHAWGHVLGLPHAFDESFQWNDAALDRVCDTAGVNKLQITQLRGNPKLDAWDSVMHYDRPLELAALPFSRRTCKRILDSNAVQVLNELYPTAREFELIREWCSDMPGWKGKWTEETRLEKFHTSKWSSPYDMCALDFVDLGTSGDYMASVYIGSTGDPKVRRLGMSPFGSTSHITNLRANFLFLKWPDSNIQMGSRATGSIRGSWYTKVQGDQFEERIFFNHSFKSVPRVSTFISDFCVEKGNWIRMSVFPQDVSKDGFTLCWHSWADTICHNIGAHWIAHEVDDVSIRSGRWEPPAHPGPWATEDRGTVEYDKPLIARPREVFSGFNHVDVRGGIDARFRCEVTEWNEHSVDMKISTWNQENAYHKMGASYIALL